MNLDIKTTGFDTLAAKYDRMSNLTRALRRPMEKSVNWVRSDLAKYVRKSPGAFTRTATPGQKRAFWARVKSGEARITGSGYRRTGESGRRWTTLIEEHASGVTGIIANNARSARWIWSHRKPGGQQPFHKLSGFPTDEEVLVKNSPRIAAEFSRTIELELRK